MSQHICISHPVLVGQLVAVDVVLGMSSGKGFVHRIIGTYAPWNPGIDYDKFWTQVAKVCHGSQHWWSLAGDLNATLSSVERLSGGTDARRLFTRFLQEDNGLDLWENKVDRNWERNWTCRAHGSSTGGNIIDCVVMSYADLLDGEIYVAEKDFIPRTDHRAIICFLNIKPLQHLDAQHVIFNMHEAT